MGNIGHGVYSELAVSLVLELVDETKNLVVWFERFTRLIKRFRDLVRGDVEFVRDAVVTVRLRDETALVVGPSGRGEDGLESFGRNGSLGVRRPGEEYIAKVEDEGRRFRQGHDCYIREERGTGERGADWKNEGKVVKYL